MANNNNIVSLAQYSDSKSLWNYTLSPGWTKKEVEIYRLVLIKHGIGKWSEIIKNRYLPHKTANQLNMQMQRMMGQQSTAAFFGLHIDPRVIYEINKLKPGTRKNGGCLINDGNNPDKEEVHRKLLLNKKRYELDGRIIEKIKIPSLKSYEIGGSRSIMAKDEEKIRHKTEKLEDLFILKRMLESEILIQENSIKHPKFSIGDSVKAKWKDDEYYFKGEVVGYKLDDTESKVIGFSIQFDDGDFDENIPSKHIKLVLKRDLSFFGPERQIKDIYSSNFKPADRVLIKGQTIPGVVAKVSTKEGSSVYSVTLDNGEHKENIMERDINFLTGSAKHFTSAAQPNKRKHSASSRLPTKKARFSINQRVEARWDGGDDFFPGVIVSNSNTKYSISYDDGDFEKNVPESLIRTVVTEKKEAAPSVTSSSEEEGEEEDSLDSFVQYDRIVVTHEGKEEDGIVVSVGSAVKSYRIELDNVFQGKKRLRKIVNASDLHLLQRERGHFKKDDLVESLWKNGIDFYCGKIVKENTNGTYEINYDDGDNEKDALPENIRKLKAQ